MPTARDRCKVLITATRDVLTWDTDGRFGCAVAGFSVGDAARIRGILGMLEYEWTSGDTDQWPGRVGGVAAHLGLRAGQVLYTSDPADDVMLWAAWWPWGNGQRISVRVGADGVAVAEALLWFGLA